MLYKLCFLHKQMPQMLMISKICFTRWITLKRMKFKYFSELPYLHLTSLTLLGLSAGDWKQSYSL